MTFSKLALTTAAILAFSTSAFAQAATPQIGVVNLQKVMTESTAAKSMREQIDAKQKSFQADLSKKVEALQKEKQELVKQQGVLAKPAFEEKARAFNAKETEAQKEFKSKKEVIDGGAERALLDIQKNTLDVIAEISKERNLSLALSGAPVLYNDSKLDISDEVLARLNKKLPKLDVKFEAKSDKK